MIKGNDSSESSVALTLHQDNSNGEDKERNLQKCKFWLRFL